MARWLISVVTLAAVAIGAGCGLGGQSGTEGSMDNPCVCEGVGERTPFRGTVTAHEGTVWTILVEELLSEPVEPDSNEPPAPGEELTGTWDASGGCGDGLELAVGDTVLARHSPGYEDQPPCPEYQECSLDRCGPFPEDDDPTDEDVAEWDRCDSECLEETREECAQSTPPEWHEGSFSLAARGADGWLFGERSGEPLRIGDDEPELITDQSACYDRFAANACEDYRGPGECM
ncbi:MAG: hypothetical protein HYY06_04825 [Deltaproteobacteria bacterium]|nr:hypothetical protein [Deltaproteobacteria bacterium]